MGLQIKKVSQLFLVQKKGLHNVEEKSTKIRVPIGTFRGLEIACRAFTFSEIDFEGGVKLTQADSICLETRLRKYVFFF